MVLVTSDIYLYPVLSYPPQGPLVIHIYCYPRSRENLVLGPSWDWASTEVSVVDWGLSRAGYVKLLNRKQTIAALGRCV